MHCDAPDVHIEALSAEDFQNLGQEGPLEFKPLALLSEEIETLRTKTICSITKVIIILARLELRRLDCHLNAFSKSQMLLCIFVPLGSS